MLPPWAIQEDSNALEGGCKVHQQDLKALQEHVSSTPDSTHPPRSTGGLLKG